MNYIFAMQTCETAEKIKLIWMKFKIISMPFYKFPEHFAIT